jgi:hypothetical protein
MFTRLDGNIDWPFVVFFTLVLASAWGATWTYLHWAHYGELSADQKVKVERLETCQALGPEAAARCWEAVRE